MANKLVSLHKIVDSTLRHPMLKDLAWEAAVDYAVDFMNIVGAPSMFTDKVVTLKLEEYRTELPEDFISTIQVRHKNDILVSTDDSFYFSDNKKLSATNYPSFKIQNNVLYSSIKEGDIELSYKAIEIDEEGFPMVPDNSSFTRALSLYIKKQWFTILFDMGKINGQVLNNTQQEYAWAVGDCETEFRRLDLNSAEGMYNQWRQWIADRRMPRVGFKSLSNRSF